MGNEAVTILQFLALSERLKRELRHSWLSDGRRESVAEHTWQMALLALLGYRYLEQPVDIGRVLKMIIVHDLVEAIAGDVPYFENGSRKQLKAERERAAIDEIRAELGAETGQELHDLWHEFEARSTLEAKYASALDHLEVQIQHNLAGIDTWEPIEYDLVYTKMSDRCAHDAFLTALCDAVRGQAESKMLAASIDVESIKARLGVQAPSSNRSSSAR
ncbi:HD family hydrolase [Bradyrhizobium sp. LMG 9283]|uniref:HD domain-containing protein n=1 Tax=Bradyrhizobium sp. LMG 9283 TaxID=592064 RepID=UPI003890B32B